MGRKKLWMVAAIATAVAMIPAAAFAVFSSSSSSSTPAITGTNSSTGPGVVGRNTRSSGDVRGVAGSAASTTGRGVVGIASTNSGATNGVRGEADSTGGRGVVGLESSATGLTLGVFGVANSRLGTGVQGSANSGDDTGFPWGVYGEALNSEGGVGVVGAGPEGVGVLGSGLFGIYGVGLGGVIGDSGFIGDGSFGLVSFSDVGISGQFGGGNGGHLLAGVEGNVAGTCTLAVASMSASCPFQTAFGTGVTPIVVVTPRTNPNGNYWVSTASPTGFTLNRADATQATTFNFVVVGIDEANLGTASATGIQSRAVTTTAARGAHALERGR